MQSQSTLLGLALFVSAAFAAPTPQITTTISEPVLGWPGASVQSTQIDAQQGDYIPAYLPWGSNGITAAGQYDRECSIFRRWRGQCSLDRPWYGGSWYGNNNNYDDDWKHKRSVEVPEATEGVKEKRAEAATAAKQQWPSNYYNNYWQWLQYYNWLRGLPVGSSTFSGLSSSFSLDNGAPVLPAYYPGWTPPSGWTPPLGYYAPSGWAPSGWPTAQPAQVGTATFSGLGSTFSVDK